MQEQDPGWGCVYAPCAQAGLAARKLSIESRRAAFDAAVREGAYSLDEQAAAPKALGDLLEALAGAVFCDSGGDFERTWQVQPTRDLLQLMAVNIGNL